jgi:hypothetical protein
MKKNYLKKNLHTKFSYRAVRLLILNAAFFRGSIILEEFYPIFCCREVNPCSLIHRIPLS